ncbi:amidohydrolase [Alkalicella caledoniensis]|uniref:Amidohydrolase n=1 Tax=Alkalicella caledoniensis TaxID=2731377 RepID=A0A7G9W7N0_ALKCA|nr:amidohydrolase [Alkalicella caledoniensis]QNO14692.1 amidohydrolase [Alkalicella caledoniensis]
MDIKKEIYELKDELIALRRDFHQHPELGFQEFRTQEVLERYLIDCGLEVKRIAKTGLVALLKGDKPGRTLLMRSDMDALPIVEENDVPYKSVNNGVMHACAHDGHMAMMLIAAKILSKKKEQLQGNIKFVFQPNEEDAGAKYMIDEGVLDNPRVDAAIGIHLWSPIETGKIGIAKGPLMASSEYFTIKIKGKGGHGGAPHASIDPIICASSIVQQVQQIQSRKINVISEPTVITFGSIQGGDFPIIIPESAKLEGSIRCLHGNLDKIKELFERKIRCQCESDETTYELTYKCGNRLLSNDPEITELVEGVAAKVVGEENIKSDVQDMLGEDFSEFSSNVPSCFYFVGIANKEKETDYFHHHPKFNIDEDALFIGVEMHVRAALEFLTN